MGSSLLLNLVRKQKMHSVINALTYIFIMTDKRYVPHTAHTAAGQESLTNQNPWGFLPP